MRKLIPVLCLFLAGCGYDPDAVTEHTPVTDNAKRHQYFLECLDRMANMPGRQEIKYNGDTVEKCDTAAREMATRYNGSWAVRK